jgi:hypothetical protein
MVNLLINEKNTKSAYYLRRQECFSRRWLTRWHCCAIAPTS